MSLVVHLIGSLLLCFLTFCLCRYLIGKKQLTTRLSWFQSRDVWKRYDYFWYGSGLLALAAFWMANVEQSHRRELDSLSAMMHSDASNVVGVLRAASGFCSTTDYADITDKTLLGGCIWVNGTLELLEAQASNPRYPTVPISQTIHGFDFPIDEQENGPVAGGMTVVSFDWYSLIATLNRNLSQLSELVATDNNRFLLPSPHGLPIGSEMDNRLRRIHALRTEIIPAFSPLRIQGVWWLYAFAFLIGLKMSKTYAELRLPS